MSVYLTTAGVILAIQIISIIGFFFLSTYTMISYRRMQNKILLFISIAFGIIGLSILLRIIISPFENSFLIDSAYLEAIIESTQFLAAFFFFYGLRLIKKPRGTE